MDLVLNTMSHLTTIGSVVAFVALVVQVFWTSLSKDPLLGPILNTTLVALESTKDVWKPILAGALVLVKPIVRALVLLIREGFRFALQAIRMLRAAGVDVSAALRQFAVTLSDFGSSVVIVARAVGKGLFYAFKGLSIVLSSVESVVTTVHRILFTSHKVTWEDLTMIAFPLGVVLGLLLITIWRSRPTRVKDSFSESTVPRRSSRLARKRAMLLSADLQTSVPSCAEPTPMPPNL